MMYEEIKWLEGKGKLKKYLRIGLVSLKHKSYYDIYVSYLVELEKNKKEKDGRMQSISNITTDYRVCERTVYKAINLMSTSI